MGGVVEVFAADRTVFRWLFDGGVALVLGRRGAAQRRQAFTISAPSSRQEIFSACSLMKGQGENFRSCVLGMGTFLLYWTTPGRALMTSSYFGHSLFQGANIAPPRSKTGTVLRNGTVMLQTSHPP